MYVQALGPIGFSLARLQDLRLSKSTQEILHPHISNSHCTLAIPSDTPSPIIISEDACYQYLFPYTIRLIVTVSTMYPKGHWGFLYNPYPLPP